MTNDQIFSQSNLTYLLVTAIVGYSVYIIFGRTKKYPSNYVPSNQSDLIDFLHYHRRMVFNKRVIKTLKYVDRSKFLGENGKKDMKKYSDDPKPIGFNATISAPHMHAIGLDLLGDFLPVGGRALDIGSGSGYVSACLSHMVGPSGKVIGVEHIEELVEQSKLNIESLDPKLLENIEFTTGDGLIGYAEGGPYDVIYAGAAAPTLPIDLINQLKPNGRMVIPVGPENLFHELMVVTKDANSKITITSQGVVRFVPLTSKEKQMAVDHLPNVTKVHNIGGQKTLVRVDYFPAPDTANLKKIEEELNKKIQESSKNKIVQ
ncbi:hypothetical protein DLAC_07469 [Tieghemostelium lacteum]|uniref:Protein-L-isoaspartate O-methyltransferase n=1 Tax=Tieghemostelium lacteum TaxID=361077 RepID=A0A151ZCM8_TIELA|nr:hypothetical protein DLAC_07469 [Tieghemostelium lacteum]|eukprot:KYQ91691.1 hypothetical protein DLAC_07469 [Tieghemostelium lacteum]